MKTPRTLLLLALGLSIAACAPSRKLVTLKADTSLFGGRETEVKLQAPENWYQSVMRPDRAVFTAPDNFSSMAVAIQPVLSEEGRCPELARRAAQEAVFAAARGNEDVKPEYVALPHSPEVADFRLTVPATPPGPNDKYVQGRAICRRGALAVATCSTGIERMKTTGEDCLKALSSLTIEPAGAGAAAPQTGGLGLSSPAPAAPEPAARLERPNTPNLNERRWENVLATVDQDLGVARDQWKFRYEGDNRYVFSSAAKTVEYLLYCSYGNCAWSSDLLGRALFDLGCKDVKITVLGEATRGVEGCGQKASYTFNPFNKSWEGGK